MSNASQPSGSLVSGNREILVQTGTFIESAADVKRLVVGVFDGKPVFMSDCRHHRATDPDQPSRYVWHGEQGRRANTAAVDACDAVDLEEARRECRRRRRARSSPAQTRSRAR